MTKLRMFKEMTQDERTSALEGVIEEKLRLFVLMTPKKHHFIVPTDVLCPRDGNEIDPSNFDQYRFYRGFF